MYSQTIYINSNMVNMRRKLRASELFRLTQQASAADMEQSGLGKRETVDRGFLWVIARQEAVISSLPEYGDSVLLDTWAGDTVHMFFPRFSKFTDKSGKILIETSSIWALIDINTRKFIDPAAEGINSVGDVPFGVNDLPSSIKRRDIINSCAYTVPYSSTDLNGHMSNIRYLDLAEDLIPEISSNKDPRRIYVEYSNELKFSETVTIGWTADNRSYYFSGDGDKHKFTLLFEYM